jgi:Na+-translocating ferredoxin:NAD+ oxidoreductase subunit D
VTLLGTLGLLSALFYDSGSSASLGSPAFHWLSGGVMLAAFFVATDPVSSPAQRRARLLYAALIGALIFAIRSWGAYPDGIAFAVLLANACGPALDRYCRLHQPPEDGTPLERRQNALEPSDEDLR